jgi:hypothetical protein
MYSLSFYLIILDDHPGWESILLRSLLFNHHGWLLLGEPPQEELSPKLYAELAPCKVWDRPNISPGRRMLSAGVVKLLINK